MGTSRPPSHRPLKTTPNLSSPCVWTPTARTADCRTEKPGRRAQVGLKFESKTQDDAVNAAHVLSAPGLGDKEGVQFSEPQKCDFHISFSRQLSQHSTGTGNSCLRCPVYVYNCSLEHLKEQLVQPSSSRQARDVFFR